MNSSMTAPGLFLVTLIGMSGCGGGDDPSPQSAGPWGNDVTVIGADGLEKNYAAPTGDACITGEGAACITTTDRCGQGAPADVMVNEDGTVVDIVCYPTEGVLTPEEIEAREGNLAQNQNGSVVVLDDSADGVDLTGNLAIDANKVVVYGYGPDVSVMSGDLAIDGNNSIVRGIRVQGNLDVLKNDSILVFCVIEGNVRIVGNNTRLSGCDIFGSVRIEGSNTVLNGNRIRGGIESDGVNTTCTDNLSFTDSNEDRVVAPEEVGAALSCE